MRRAKGGALASSEAAPLSAPQSRVLAASSAYNEKKGSVLVFPRIREIIDPFGLRLRVTVTMDPSGASVTLERPDQQGGMRLRLDAYGAELLSGYIMASRLALPQDLPAEQVEGAFPCELRLSQEPKVAIEISGKGAARPLDVTATFWDKLYAELCLAIPHARELSRRRAAPLMH